MDYICYQKRKKYTNYRLEEPVAIEIDLNPPQDIHSYKISLVKNNGKSLLTIKERYTWDGPSGPTLDTKSFMRGSLAHDALYQLMRLDLLDRVKYRIDADRTLRKICRQDGMNPIRAWYVFWAVHLCAKGAAGPEARLDNIYAPHSPAAN